MGERLFTALFVLILGALPACAEFEGALEMKISVADGDGKAFGGGSMNLSLSKVGSRMEMDMQAPVAMKMVMLTRTDTPDKLFRINDDARSYSETDVAKKRDRSKEDEDNVPWTVKKLGEEEVLGYQTKHVMVTHGDDVRELWTNRELIDYATYSNLQASRGRMGAEEGMVKVLKAEGVDGMPLKAIIGERGMKTTIELVKVDKKSIPASMFEIPSGYTKAAGGLPVVSGASSDPSAVDARKKRIDEAMKNMSPEQREMFEKLMKQRQGGNSP